MEEEKQCAVAEPESCMGAPTAMAGGAEVASGAVPTDWDVPVMLVRLSVACSELGEEVFGCSI